MPSAKKTIPDISTIANADGTFNAEAAMVGVQTALDQLSAGHIDLDGVKASQKQAGSSNKPGRTKKIHVVVEFDRHE